MRAFKGFFALCVVCVCLFSSAYGEYSYVENQYIAFTEPNGFERFNSYPGFTAECQGNKYSFAHNIPEELRDSCIDQTNTLLQFFATYGAQTQGYEIVIVSKSYPARVDAFTLYIGYDAIGSTEYAVGVAKLCFGNDVNYGMLYGVAVLAMEADGRATEPLPAVNLALHALDPSYLDLNYACFINPYATEESISYVRSVACNFVASLSPKQIVEFLNGNNEQMYVALNNYLETQGYPMQDFSRIANISIHGGGSAIRIVICGEFVTYHVQYDFHDYVAGVGIYEDPLNGDYAELRETILSLERQIELIRAVFVEYDMPKRVNILFHDSRTYYGHEGAYTSEKISAGSIVAVAHEYVHAIVTPLGLIEPWINEVLAHYYGSTPTEYGDVAYIDYWTQYAQYCFENHELDDQTMNLISEYLATSKAPLDPFSREAHVAVGHYIAWCDENRIKAVKDITSGRGAKYSYYDFLLSTYGEGIVLHAAIENTPKELLGATWDETINMWVTWLYGKPDN